MAYTILSLIILILLLTVFVLRKTKRSPSEGKLKVTSLTDKYRSVYVNMLKSILGPKAKVLINWKNPQKVIYVIDFKGGIQAQQVESLREEVSAILAVAKMDKPDEVIVKLDSPGGTVTGYGLAAAQLARIRKAGIPLTVVVDQVAASGGYMMASVANKIIASPFAVIGSVGVVMEFPNFSKLLEKVGVKYSQYTAGEFKRTISPMVEPTAEGEQKTKEKLEKTLDLFKSHIKQYREQVNVDEIATGETWYGIEALDKKMIDEVSTYDEYLESKLLEFDVFKVKYEKTEKITRKLSLGLASVVNHVVEYWVDKTNFINTK